jgi:hypothetical protein
VLGRAGIAPLIQALKSVNESLWEIEDSIRRKEAELDFGPSFVELARSVYKQNDRRAALKKEINVSLNSALVEEKSYAGSRGIFFRGDQPNQAARSRLPSL